MLLHYKLAAEQDGEEISRLLEDVEFKGEVSIAYCRRPNAVLSLARDGDKSAFVIGKDNEGNIAGCGACVINRDIAYLTGLRAARRGNIPKCYELLREFCAKNNVRLTYTTILKENVKVQAMLEKQRPFMPNYLRHSELVVNIIRKNLRIKDKNKLVQNGEFYVLVNSLGGEIARGKALEQWDYKQYVVKHYSRKMRLFKHFFRWMPNENEVLKFFTLREVDAKDNPSLESFLRHISKLPNQGNFFLYGGEFCPVKSWKYRSIVYIVDWEKTISDVSNIQLNIEISDL